MTMTTEVLGNYSFTDTPTVAGAPVMLNSGGVPAVLADVTANRPLAGAGPIGRIFLDTTLNRFYRDDGSVWVDLTAVPNVDGTANQVDVVDGTNVTASVVSLSDNPILPGTARVRLPVGTTAQRPGSAAPGDVRFNSTLGYGEKYTGAYWSPFGLVLQQSTGNIAATSGSTQIPWDNTTPLITEGIQIFSQSFTPLSATSRIIVEFTTTVSGATAGRSVTTSVFYGSAIIGAVGTYVQTASVPYASGIRLVYQPGSTATVTIQGRFGANGSGTVYVNQTSSGTLGGAAVTQYSITEIE